MRTCMEWCQALQPTELRGDGEEVAATFVIVSGYSLYVDGLALVAVTQAAEVRCFSCADPLQTHDHVTGAPHHSHHVGATVQQLPKVWHLLATEGTDFLHASTLPVECLAVCV
jgi:hypothetical protein